MTISIIAAYDQNRVIGNKGDLPWRIPGDLKYFKEKTMGKTVIMGRRTYESIGKPLPERENVVVTRTIVDHPEVTSYTSSLSMLKESCRSSSKEIFVIGGEGLYADFMPVADKMFLTFVDHAFEGDAFFPKYDPSEWLLHSEKCSMMGGIVEGRSIKVCYAEFWRKL